MVRSTREIVLERSAELPSANCYAIRGNAAVERAMPNKATGNPAINQAYVMLDIAELPTFEAKNVVVTTKLTCPAMRPMTLGAMRRRPSVAA